MKNKYYAAEELSARREKAMKEKQSSNGVQKMKAALCQGQLSRYLDPKRYPPAALSPAEKDQYVFFVKKKRLKMAEAMSVIGRADLLCK